MCLQDLDKKSFPMNCTFVRNAQRKEYGAICYILDREFRALSKDGKFASMSLSTLNYLCFKTSIYLIFIMHEGDKMSRFIQFPVIIPFFVKI